MVYNKLSPHTSSTRHSKQPYSIANAATAAAPRPKNDWLLNPDAELAVCCAGLETEGEGGRLPAAPPAPPPLLGVVPDGPEGVLPPAPEPAAWPGLRFSEAWAASAVKPATVLLPDAGLLEMC